MTAQLAEKLIIDPGAIALPPMKLYSVLVGDIDNPKSASGYKFITEGTPSKMAALCSALWRGYVSTYRLKADGALVLERLEYPFADGASAEDVHEVLQGDFWIDLRDGFFGDSVRVPFVDGKIQADSSLWRRRAGASFRKV